MNKIGELITAAKAVKGIDGVINISTVSPCVLLRKDVFDELFPKWTDTEQVTNDNGVVYEIRSITLDGVTFSCVTTEAGE